MKIVYAIKHFFDRKVLGLKIKSIGKNSYVKYKYDICGGECIVLGDGVYISENATIHCITKYNDVSLKPRLVIADRVFFNKSATVYCADSITIGEQTYFGSNVTITDENHGMNPELELCYGLQSLDTKAITIGKKCWIGDKTVILPGVSIGDFSIVGASSVVTKSVPEYSMCCGNPAKVIKRWNHNTKKWEKV